MAFFKQGKFMLACGPLSRDARRHDFDSGKSVVNFTVKYDSDEKLIDENGRRKGLYVDVKAWASKPLVFEMACCLEKGDIVQVIGELQREKKPDRDGNVKWYLDAEYIAVQQSVQAEEEPEGFSEDETEGETMPKEFAETNNEFGDEFPEVLR